MNLRPLMIKIPNLLTGLRFVIAVIFPLVPSSWWLSLVVIGLLTEFFDGYLSRRWHAVSALGKMMDPVADKLFVLAVIGTLIHADVLAIWQVALVLARDIAVVGGLLWLAVQGRFSEYRDLPPRPLGKWATTGQFLVLLNAVSISWQLNPLVIATGVISGAAAIDYLRFAFSQVGAFSNRPREKNS